MTKKGGLMAMSKGFAIVLTCLLLLLSLAPGDLQAACGTPAKIVGDAYSPTSIQDAYNYASQTMSSFTLQLAGEVYVEDLTFNGGSVVLDGGYDCSFSSKSGTTGIFGKITIGSGAVQFGGDVSIVSTGDASGPFDRDNDGFFDDVDCDDYDPNIYPGAAEVCDGVDNDCNGQVDELMIPVDVDGDGYYGAGSCNAVVDDCNDNDATIHPGALDTPYDGIDQDCNGADLTFAEDNYCSYCHGDASGWTDLHVYTSAPDATCVDCHAATVSNILPGHYGQTVRTAGNNMNAGAVINCASCHDQVSRFHSFGANIVWPKVVASQPDTTCDSCHENRAAAHDTATAHDNRVIDSACATCHSSDTTTLGSPGNGTLISAADVDALHRSDCVLCHNYTGTTTDAGAVRQAIEQGMNGTPISCRDCHTILGVNHGNHDHPVVVGPNDLSFGSPGLLCNVCHVSNDWAAIEALHDVPINGDGPCATCHWSPRTDVSNAIDVGANPTYCNDCHADKYLADHGVDHTAAGYVSASAPCLACHDPGPGDNVIVTVTHKNDCSLCHSTIPNLNAGVPAVGDCASCHPDRHAALSCDACHGHLGNNTTLTANHPKHVGSTYNFSCAKCHAATVSDSYTISNPSLHINEQTDVSLQTGTYTTGTQACDNLSCHSDGNGGAPNRDVAWSDSTATVCTDCHGDLADPDPDLVSDPYKMTSNGHDVLASTKWIRQYDCDYCHYYTTDSAGNIKNGGYHVNEQKDVVIDARWKMAGRDYPTYDAPTKNCDNLYCHSDGRSVNPVVRDFNWESGVAYCDSCHGHQGDCVTCHDGVGDNLLITAWPQGKEWMNATPMYENTGPGSSNANSHVRHLQTNFSCENCHFTTIEQANPTCVECHIEGQDPIGSMDEVGHVDPAFHVNKNKDVVFKDGGTYDPVTKSCADTSCHSGAYEDPVWGGKVKCLTCHGTSGDDIDDFDGTNATQARINMTEWETTGHGRQTEDGPYPSGNPAANFPADNPCWHCHDRTIVHDDDSNPFRLQVHPQFEKRFEKECVYCHMEGLDSECLGCHDSPGSLATQIDTILTPTNHTGMTSCTATCHIDDASRHQTDAGQWTAEQKDDIKNQYVMMGVCLQCHDNDDNGRCNTCHTWSGDPADDPYKIGFDPGGIGFISGSSKASSGHFGHKHWQTYLGTGKWKGGKFCWDCHDPHGDSNLYMIQDQVATETEGQFGKPVTRAEVVFTKNNSGVDYAKTEAPYNGICNVCHQDANHYIDTYGDGHRASRKCTECHNHDFGGGHASGGDCNSCHNNRPIPNHLGFGLPRDCTKCHDGAILLRMDIMRQFNGQSHHVQGIEVDNKHCYECHWESTPEGLIDNDYHQGYNYKTYTTIPNAPSDLVIYGPETRPTTYMPGVTATTFDATKVGTVDERAEVAKVTEHCLGCHSDQNNDYTPFGDCKTPRQYAWDRQSIEARYSQAGTTTWGKYSGTNAADKNIQKAFSAHGNAVANQGGWDAATGEDGTLPNTRNGAQNVQCFDCHSSHGSYTTGVTSSYATFDGSYGGGNLKETQAGKGGYGVTYKAVGTTDGINPMTPAAAQCFDCHENETAGAMPWGYNSTYGATAPIMGYRDSSRFGDGERGTQVRFPFKAGRSNMGGHLKASSPLTNGAMVPINGSCTPCHDPHGVSPTLGAKQEFAVPLLKGTWLTSPFKEDSPQRTANRNTSSNVYPGRKLFGTTTGTTQGPANKMAESAEQFAGLCLRCHPKENLTDGIDKNTAFTSLDRVHETVTGWGNNAEHTYSCSKCHQAHVSGLPRLMRTNCLDWNHRGDVASGGPSPSRRSDTQSYPRMNNIWPACHETETGAWNNQQWNQVTTW